MECPSCRQVHPDGSPDVPCVPDRGQTPRSSTRDPTECRRLGQGTAFFLNSDKVGGPQLAAILAVAENSRAVPDEPSKSPLIRVRASSLLHGRGRSGPARAATPSAGAERAMSVCWMQDPSQLGFSRSQRPRAGSTAEQDRAAIAAFPAARKSEMGTYLID
jgi:hypothetical protein